jgi:hypothetical protein
MAARAQVLARARCPASNGPLPWAARAQGPVAVGCCESAGRACVHAGAVAAGPSRGDGPAGLSPTEKNSASF